MAFRNGCIFTLMSTCRFFLSFPKENLRSQPKPENLQDSIVDIKDKEMEQVDLLLTLAMPR